MIEMSYYDMNKCLCKELKCEFEKFEQDKSKETLEGIKDIIESMTGLMELEAGGAMREYLEDNHGYDSKTGEFNKRWNGYPYNAYNVYNSARTYPMTNPPYYMNGEYGDMEYGMMDAGDGRYMNRGGRGGRGNGRGGSYNRGGDYMNDGREGEYMDDDRGMYNRGRSRDSRGRYNEGYGIYNMAHKPMKEKLSQEDIKHWMENLESESGERGPMWTKEEIESLAKKEGITFDKFSPEELYATVNSMYSDYCSTGESFNVDRPAFYISLAKDFLNDPDSIDGGGGKKLAAYYEYVVEH